MSCPRCGKAPTSIDGAFRLSMWPPMGHTAEKLKAIRGVASEAAGACVVADLDAGGWPPLAQALEAQLSRVEREAVRIIVTPHGDQAKLCDVSRMLSLEQLLARERGGWLLRALDSGALKVDFTRIGYADAPDETFAHAARLHAPLDDGGRADAQALFDVARDADFLAALDLAGRLTSIRSVAEAGFGGPVLVGFSPSAIYDPRFCLRTTVEEADKQGLAREDIIFSILPTDTGAGADIDHLENVLGYYQSNGFRTALTISPARHAPFEMLRRLRPNLMTLDPEMTRGVRSDPQKEVVARKMLEIGQKLRIETMVAGVADSDDCDWAYAHGASFVEGPFIAARATQPVA